MGYEACVSEEARTQYVEPIAALLQSNIGQGPSGAHAAVYNAIHLLSEEPELLKSITVYIVPRVSVDGAEYCVTTGGRVVRILRLRGCTRLRFRA